MELNVIVDNSNLVGDEEELFFGPLEPGETVLRVPPETDMYDLVVKLGLFSSKGQARKNWVVTDKNIPPGFWDLRNLGKLRHRLTILNPTPANLSFTNED